MIKAQKICMKGLSGKDRSEFMLPDTIDFIAENRMSGRSQMYSDLVCSAGLQRAFNIRIIGRLTDHAYMSDGPFSSGCISTHFFSVTSASSYRSVDRKLGRRQMTADHRSVFSVDAVYGKLGCQRNVSSVIFADDK